MKNDQKNPIYPSVPFSCMFEQPKVAVYGNLHNWHVNKHIWSSNLNPWFKPTSFIMVASFISSTNSILPCHDHASYCCIALIVFFPCLPIIVPSR